MLRVGRNRWTSLFGTVIMVVCGLVEAGTSNLRLPTPEEEISRPAFVIEGDGASEFFAGLADFAPEHAVLLILSIKSAGRSTPDQNYHHMIAQAMPNSEFVSEVLDGVEGEVLKSMFTPLESGISLSVEYSVVESNDHFKALRFKTTEVHGSRPVRILRESCVTLERSPKSIVSIVPSRSLDSLVFRPVSFSAIAESGAPCRLQK